MAVISSIAELPNTPSVYALYGGHERNQYVAYIGIANKLKNRIAQHLVRRDSSIATGTSAVHLNPDYVTRVAWWEHEDFVDRYVLEAAEMIAFDILNPALRSRGRSQQKAVALLDDDHFVSTMKTLFQAPPIGQMQLLTLENALERIAKLEQRVTKLERNLAGNNDE